MNKRRLKKSSQRKMTENIWKKERFFMQIFQLFFGVTKKKSKGKGIEDYDSIKKRMLNSC